MMDKRESLTSRFRRVLGRTLPDTENEEHQNGSPENQASTSRRREQVLHAQRTHRHRTQQYIRELEKEVFRLRDENEDLRKLVERMRAETSSASVRRGDGSTGQHSDFQQTSLAPTSSVTVDLTHLADAIPVGSCENHDVEISPPIYQPQHPRRSFRPTQPPTNTTPPIPNPPPLPTQLGINFILTLEQPCLPHIKHAHMGFATGTTPPNVTLNSGPAHAFTMSAALTSRYHNHNQERPSLPPSSNLPDPGYGPPQPTHRIDLEKSVLQVPTGEIERLLAASARLKLEGEVTPVQIWERVREIHQGQVGGRVVDVETVERLLRVLETYIYCNSFGAVVEKGTVDGILEDVFGGGDVG